MVPPRVSRPIGAPAKISRHCCRMDSPSLGVTKLQNLAPKTLKSLARLWTLHVRSDETETRRCHVIASRESGVATQANAEPIPSEGDASQLTSISTSGGLACAPRAQHAGRKGTSHASLFC